MVDRVIKAPCLFYFRSIKFHSVKETHDINSLLTLVQLLLHLSTKDNETNLCQDLLTIKITDSGLKQGHLTRIFDEISVRESLLVLRLSDNAFTKSD